MAKKVSVMDILEKENETLDCLLDCQSNVHIAVTFRLNFQPWKRRGKRLAQRDRKSASRKRP